jgi:hypothetical protein
MMKSFSHLNQIDSFEDRYEYLKLHGVVGESTFGFSRFINQYFYASKRWKHTRSEIIIRDNGCDMAHPDRPIIGRINIHHINPVTLDMLEDNDDLLYDPENLVCVSDYTHLAIHYGTKDLLPEDYKPRMPGDTTLW